ncbi:NAD(P)-dependent oxidoreductase [Ammoniphilus sp. 3BR4]|uniref:NAD(P)-dependent oxidoreductase n=1 Tax=Ammoniphilus sp. 3BR4 TaxID=3158265 RepID=UPI003465BBCD
MKIGFIGLGKMGGGLARNLIRTGNDVLVFDLNPAAIEETLKVGGKAARSSAELAAQADVLFTSLPLPKHLIDLLTGESGLIHLMKAGSTIIDVSTIDPETARHLADEAERNSIHFLACPLGKGPAQAEEGTEPIFAGGKREVFEQHERLLNQIGNPVTYLGDVEQSTAFKIISNLIGMSNLAVMSECLNMGTRAGIDPQLLHKLLADTGADSYQLRLRGPWILEEDYHSRFSVDLALKDIRLGVKMANGLDYESPYCRLTSDMLSRASKEGYGSEDCAAVFKLYESKVIEQR